MAIKSADQITIVDVTDAYSIILTSEAYTFVGNSTGTTVGLTCSTQAVAYCGKTQCSSVTINQSEIICPVGISASVTGSGESAPTITFTTTAVIADSCEATIPVVVDGITINKKFSFAVAKAGTDGANGSDGVNGEDAISITITSSNGTVFKNSSGSTVLTAHVFKGGIEQTINSNGVCGTLGIIKWYKGSDLTTVISSSKTYTVSASSVTNSEVYTAQLEN